MPGVRYLGTDNSVILPTIPESLPVYMAGTRSERHLPPQGEVSPIIVRSFYDDPRGWESLFGMADARFYDAVFDDAERYGAPTAEEAAMKIVRRAPRWIDNRDLFVMLIADQEACRTGEFAVVAVNEWGRICREIERLPVTELEDFSMADIVEEHGWMA